jgi:hypothetical protein
LRSCVFHFFSIHLRIEKHCHPAPLVILQISANQFVFYADSSLLALPSPLKNLRLSRESSPILGVQAVILAKSTI